MQKLRAEKISPENGYMAIAASTAARRKEKVGPKVRKFVSVVIIMSGGKRGVLSQNQREKGRSQVNCHKGS
jgi:hypothetical protein